MFVALLSEICACHLAQPGGLGTERHRICWSTLRALSSSLLKPNLPWLICRGELRPPKPQPAG